VDDPNDSFWILKPPYTLADAGMLFIFLGALYTDIEKVWVRFYGWVYRAKEPKRYWVEVSMYYLVGIGLIAYFYLLVSGPSK
jgi:hypothetical protein